MARVSESPAMKLLAYFFAICSFAIGFNAVLNPSLALSVFGFKFPKPYEQNRSIVEALMLIYGVRDLYMGVAMLTAVFYGQSKIAGWLTLAAGGIAIADGAICHYISGEGQWNHWALLPVIFIAGGTFLGMFDST